MVNKPLILLLSVPTDPPTQASPFETKVRLILLTLILSLGTAPLPSIALRSMTSARQLLLLALVGGLTSCEIPSGSTPHGEPSTNRLALSASHLVAAGRHRRIVVNYDINAQQYQIFGIDPKNWIDFRFDYADQPGSQIDAMLFCLDGGNIVHYPSKVLPMTSSERALRWLNAGQDILKVAIAAAQERGIEAFYSHRMNGSDRLPNGQPAPIPLKEQHPEWLLDGVWWEPGFWNFAVPEVRAHKLAVLRELAENYELDGIDLDFCRTPPFLPIGHAWKHRDDLTELLRNVRRTFQEVAAKRGRPLLLSVRVTTSVAGCHYDGIDIETWIREDLVDLIIIGTHSIDVDLASFQRITAGTHVQLYPCMDDEAHAPDGYRRPGIEVERGIFTNWWQQGADGVATFNWANASVEACAAVGYPAGPPSHGQAYREIGDPETLRYKNKTFVVPRKFGGGWRIPWTIYANNNVESPLPALLPGGELPVVLAMNVGDDLNTDAHRVHAVELRVLLSDSTPEDDVEVKLNGLSLPQVRATPDGWCTFVAEPTDFALGRNLIHVRRPKSQRSVAVEKVEAHVQYAD